MIDTAILKRPRGCLFHGTSAYAYDQIMSGNNKVIPAYHQSNKSLGGAYLTSDWNIGLISARNPALAHESDPVILMIRLSKSLMPDEDWVVDLVRQPSEFDFDSDSERYKNPCLQNFVDDLLSEYPGDGFSLSDEYVRRYEQLNQAHSITWKHSFRRIGSVRQEELIGAEQVLGLHFIRQIERQSMMLKR